LSRCCNNKNETTLQSVCQLQLEERQDQDFSDFLLQDSRLSSLVETIIGQDFNKKDFVSQYQLLKVVTEHLKYKGQEWAEKLGDELVQKLLMYLFKHVSSINFTCTHDFYNPTKRGHTLSPDKESIDLNFQENIITYKEEQPSEEAKTSEEASAETKIKIISRLGKWDPESSTSDSKLLQLRKLNEVHLEKILKEQDESIYNQSEEIVSDL